MKKQIIFFTLLLCFVIVACHNKRAEESHDMEKLEKIKISNETWKNLSVKKIYFGHQSVGFNIIDGIKELMKNVKPEYELKIVELSKPSRLSAPGFYHARVGSNLDPISKIDDFARQINAGIGNTADIAFFKFCFMDISSETDINKIFEHYRAIMSKLKKKYPHVKFVHFTIPLTTTISTWKTKLKVLLKRKYIWEYDSNIKKNEFNNLLKKYYNGKEPVFDIAAYESTLPDGTRSSFSKDGKEYFQLATQYTYDDGHLNEQGRKWIAQHLLIFLSQLH